jgi:hypothetical protein
VTIPSTDHAGFKFNLNCRTANASPAAVASGSPKPELFLASGSNYGNRSNHRGRKSPMKLDGLRARVATGVIVVNHPAAEIGAHRYPQDKKPEQD